MAAQGDTTARGGDVRPRRVDPRRALSAAFPIMLGYVAIGIPCGLLEGEVGIAPIFCFLISVTFYSGAGQFMIPNMLMAGSSLASIIGSVSFVNTRQMLYAAAFSPYFSKESRLLTAYFSATVTDESFGVNLDRFQQDETWTATDALLVNVFSMLSWGTANAVGAVVGSLLTLPVAVTSFAMTSIFICLLVGQKMSAEVAVTIVVAVLGVLVCKLVGLSGMAIFIGAVLGVIAGTVFGAVREK